MLEAEVEVTAVTVKADQLLAFASSLLASVGVDFRLPVGGTVVSQMVVQNMVPRFSLGDWDNLLTQRTRRHDVVLPPRLLAVVQIVFEVVDAENAVTGVAFDGQKVELVTVQSRAVGAERGELHCRVRVELG